MKLAFELRNNGIATDIYPTSAKLQKQMKYANDIRAEYVALVGESELANNHVTLRNMESGEQSVVNLSELIEKLK